MLSAAAAPSNSYRTLRDQVLSIANALAIYITTSSTHKLSLKPRDAGQPEASTFPQLLLGLEHTIFSLPGTALHFW